METEILEFEFVAASGGCSRAELAQFCSLSHEQLTELIDSGVLVPIDEENHEPRFSDVAVRRGRIAARLRDDFQLDMRSVALAVLLVEKVRDLEAQLLAFRSSQRDR